MRTTQAYLASLLGRKTQVDASSNTVQASLLDFTLLEDLGPRRTFDKEAAKALHTL